MSRISESATRLLEKFSNSSINSGLSEMEAKELHSLLHHCIQTDSAPSIQALSQATSLAKPKVSPPQYFHGDRRHLNEFITQVKLVVALQPSNFPNEKSQIVYTSSYLRGSAFSWVQPILETIGTNHEHPSLSSISEFFNHLRAAFGDPDPVATAEREISRLTQGSSSAADYAANFQRLSSRTKWNNEALKYHFIKGLNDEIQDLLATRDLPHDLGSFVSKVISLDNQMRERRLQRYSSKPSKPFSHFVPKQNYPQDSRPTHAPPQLRSTPPSDGPSPMEVGASRKQFSPLSAEERKRRVEKNLCLYCGQPGHQAKTCPVKFHRQSVPPAASNKSSSNPKN